LGISQRELAVLTGVSLGAAHQWETGKFRPKDEKKKVLVALRKIGRREVRRLLEEKAAGRVEK
jgi:DNA-binding transcriptional regulator YiaG